MGLNVLGYQSHHKNCTVAILPVVRNNLPISPRFSPYEFLSRCKFVQVSTLTTRQPKVEFYFLTFSRFQRSVKTKKKILLCLIRIELTTSALLGGVRYRNQGNRRINSLRFELNAFCKSLHRAFLPNYSRVIIVIMVLTYKVSMKSLSVQVICTTVLWYPLIASPFFTVSRMKRRESTRY